MRLTKRAVTVSVAVLLAGCSSYSTKPQTTILPSSHRSIDIVLHRGDVRLMDCATLAVLQTYDLNGQLIDSKEARGTALHCTVLPALIDAGSRVGAGAMVRPARTTISNTISAAANAGASSASASNASATGGAANAAGGAGGDGGSSGTTTSGTGDEGGHGNNGNGNGSDDGTNSGTDHHHDNGDNN